ncbi:hypothetical protein [Comamonas thiooxydans]|uniref:hypothetical protein n=1 Tax=Comamonas thiooxydans TaxID=363952 RepID=UPI00103E03D0|nr:hypothetical protein [Comamonas thiooxydans]
MGAIVAGVYLLGGLLGAGGGGEKPTVVPPLIFPYRELFADSFVGLGRDGGGGGGGDDGFLRSVIYLLL